MYFNLKTTAKRAHRGYGQLSKRAQAGTSVEPLPLPPLCALTSECASRGSLANDLNGSFIERFVMAWILRRPSYALARVSNWRSLT